MAKKVLFIDRDGTIVLEAENYQLDCLSKLEFYPKAFKYLAKIVEEFDYELAMVTNQDGLGTSSFPEDTFWPTQNFILKAFENEGVTFDEIFILAKNCKFTDCSHLQEPGCAVLNALKTGILNENKYSNFIALKKESDYYKMDKLEKKEKDRHFGKFLNQAKKDLKKYRKKDY